MPDNWQVARRPVHQAYLLWRSTSLVAWTLVLAPAAWFRGPWKIWTGSMKTRT